MERLQAIIAKLEAKLQPISEENNELKSKIELLSLDKDLAEEKARALELELEDLQLQYEAFGQANLISEQVTERNIALSQQVAELKSKIEHLEALKEINDELEEQQREEIANLESLLSAARNELALSALSISDLTAAINKTPRQTPQQTPERPPPKPTLLKDNSAELDRLRQEIGLLQLELDAARLDLETEKSGILPALAKRVEPLQKFSLELRYKLRLNADDESDSKLSALYDGYRSGNMSKKELLSGLEDLYEHQEKLLIEKPKFSAQLAREYLYEKTGNRDALQIPDNLVSSALEDPDSIQELKNAQEAVAIPIDEPETVEEDELAAKERELESLRLKLEILNGKATKAGELAKTLTKLQSEAETTRKSRDSLAKELASLEGQLKEKDRQIVELESSQAPNWDITLYKQTVASMQDTIRLLHRQSRRGELELAPLRPGKAMPLTGLCGNAKIAQIWEAIDTFRTVPRRGCRKAYYEQLRKLSLIDE